MQVNISARFLWRLIMSKVLKISISDEDYYKLEKEAKGLGISVQNHIRQALNIGEKPICRDEIVGRINKLSSGTCFTLNELFKDDDRFNSSTSGVISKDFKRLVDAGTIKNVVLVGPNSTNRHLCYKKIK